MGNSDIIPDAWTTLVWTWVVMALLAGGSWLVTQRLSTGPKISRWQNFLEVIVGYTREQIRQIAGDSPGQYLPFVGTLFLFIAVSNALMVVPGYVPPTSSLLTTIALAVCVFVAVPVYGIINEGFWRYVKHYVEPNPIMLPFNLIGEVSRTLALAVRLFGNVMSGVKVAAIIVAIIPFFVTVVLDLFGLLTGLIQAYIFAMLAIIYIASGRRKKGETEAAL